MAMKLYKEFEFLVLIRKLTFFLLKIYGKNLSISAFF